MATLLLSSERLLANLGSICTSTLTASSPIYHAFRTQSLTSHEATSSHTATILGTVNALFAGGAAIGGISQGWLGDWLGRVKALGLAAALTLIGSALLAGAVNISMLIVARFIQGVGLGQMLALSTLYVAEVAPPHRRGLLTALTPCSYGCGYLM